MEHQKIANSLGNIPDKVPRFIIKKWIEVHDQSGETYSNNKQKVKKKKMKQMKNKKLSFHYKKDNKSLMT